MERIIFCSNYRKYKKYLVKDGYYILNLKDTKRYSMLSDAIEMAEQCGFKIYNIHELKNIQRNHGSVYGRSGIVDNSEKIVVFKQTN